MSTWIAETLFATTVLMAIVLIVRGRVAAMFGARIAYLLWLLPALRMVLPPMPESFGPPPMAHIPVIVDLSDFISPVTPTAIAPMEQSFPWITVLLALWLAGAVVHLGWHLLAYHGFVKAALKDRTDLPELDARGIEVCASKMVEGPFAAGIFIPTIVLPHDYRTRHSAEELRLAMRHEAIHHDRGDLSINLVALVIISLHWFNPVAHRAWRAFRNDQELACDAIVLNGASLDERHSYGLALVKSTGNRAPIAACSLNPRDQLKQRLRMMKSARNRRGSGTMLAITLVTGGLTLTASGGFAAETTREIRREVAEKVMAPAAKAVGIAQPPAAPGAPAPLEPDAAWSPAAAPQPPEPATATAAGNALGWTHEDAENLHADLENSRRDREEGLRDAEQARWDAQIEMRAAQVETRAAHMAASAAHTKAFSVTSGSAGKCKSRKAEALVSISGEAGKSQHTSVSICGDMSKQQVANVTLDAVMGARNSVARHSGLANDERVKALAAMDFEIARLKRESAQQD